MDEREREDWEQPQEAEVPAELEDTGGERSLFLPGFESDENAGNVQISDEVVGIIAGIAASEVDGIAGMSGGFVGGISEMLGKRNFAKGVRVDIKDDEVAISLYMSVEYGVRIPRVAQDVQEKVKNAVESMTGLDVTRVNIHIQGVAFPGEEKVQETRARS